MGSPFSNQESARTNRERKVMKTKLLFKMLDGSEFDITVHQEKTEVWKKLSHFNPDQEVFLKLGRTEGKSLIISMTKIESVYMKVIGSEEA
jgi:hypothetical protein